MKKFWRNERGAALILALMLSMVIAVSLTALVLSTQQGQRNSIHDGHAERANYVAESGAVIVKRLVKNAAANQVRVREMSEADLNKVLGDIKPSFTLDGTNTLRISSTKENESFLVNVSGKSKYTENLQRETTITLPILLNTAGGGTGGDGMGIFGDDVVGTSVTAANTAMTKQWVRHWEDPKQSAPGEYYGILNYQEQMTNYFSQQVDAADKGKPFFRTSSISPVTPAPTAFADGRSYTSQLCSQTSFDYQSPHLSGTIYCKESITIYLDQMQLSGTIMSDGDIIVKGARSGSQEVSNFQLSGKLVAKGNVTFEHKIRKGTISGNLYAGGHVVFNQPVANDGEEVVFSGEIVSQGMIQFKSQVTRFTSSGRMISGKSIQFDGNLGGNLTFKDNAKLHSQDSILFNGTLDGVKFAPQTEIYAKKDIEFGKTLQNGTVLSKVAAGSRVTFSGNLDRTTVTGDVIANGLLAFHGNINDGTVFKGNLVNNSTTTDLMFNAGSRLVVEKSIYSARGIDFRQLNGLKVGRFELPLEDNDRYGAIYAYGDIRMSMTLSYLNVSGAILSRDQSVIFPKLFGCNAKSDCYVGSFVAGTAGIQFNHNLDGFMYFGGLSTAQHIRYNGNQNGPPNTIRIARQAPKGYTEGAGGNDGVIRFGGWKTKS
ncbi:hypothetical protein [Paenibacillus puerhi]|uniref:hypothetical protein n=1 Tax=Paenibacillus puerhi TaxID=2692622 RepID=UPI001356FDFF|nr:hypothetical protein [Paenibacillus puerhi]